MRIKNTRAKKVTTGIRLESFFELRIPTKIIGAIMAVPVKLVLASSTKCSVLTIEKIRASNPKIKIKTLVIDTAFLSSHSEVDRALAGRPGTRLQLVVAKPAKAAEQVTLELAPTSPTSVTGRLLTTGNEQVAVITIRAFRPGTGEQFKRQLQALTTKAGGALAGIVLDLRNNPGGEVSEAVIIADAFISKGLIVRTRGRSGRIMREEQAHTSGTDTQTPIVVVQNRFSASASELLTIALQDHGRAKVIGEKSFGKGTIQQVQGLPDGSLLTLTIARYYSPRDHRIDGRGVTPDVLAAEPSGKPDAWLTQATSLLGSSGPKK